MDLFLGHPQLQLLVNEITYPSHILDTGPLPQCLTLNLTTDPVPNPNPNPNPNPVPVPYPVPIPNPVPNPDPDPNPNPDLAVVAWLLHWVLGIAMRA